MLIGFDVDGVYPDGHANLSLSSGYEASYTFRSPAESKRPADLPKNVEADIYCIVNVDLMSGEIQVYTSARDKCAERAIKPKCTLKEAWQKGD